MPWPKGKPRSLETNAKVGRPGRSHPQNCNHCASLRGKPSGHSGKRHEGADLYKRAHSTIVTLRGKPTQCEHCHTLEGRFNWALNHEKPSHSFSELSTGQWISNDPMDYISLCTKCHGVLDRLGVPRGNYRSRVRDAMIKFRQEMT